MRNENLIHFFISSLAALCMLISFVFPYDRKERKASAKSEMLIWKDYTRRKDDHMKSGGEQVSSLYGMLTANIDRKISVA